MWCRALLLLLFIFVNPGWCTIYRGAALPELVGRSDIIVTGEVIKSDEEQFTIKVAEVIAGQADATLVVRRWEDMNLKENVKSIYFLERTKVGLMIAWRPGIHPIKDLPQVRDYLAMKQTPSKFFNNPKYRESPDFVELLGYAAQSKTKLGDVDTKDAVALFVALLTDKNEILAQTALSAYWQSGQRDMRPLLPLIDHADEWRREAAFGYFWLAKDKNLVEPLCKKLDSLKDNDNLGAWIMQTLAYIGSPDAIPAVERALKQKNLSAVYALGVFGNAEHFAVVLDVMVKEQTLLAEEALRMLVKRSNKPSEKWMQRTVDTRVPENNAEWQKWWAANKKDFAIVRTWDEAQQRK